MARKSNLTFRSAVLAARLRELRSETGLTSVVVAKQLGWEQSKISRIETATSAADPQDVTKLLDLYGVDTATRASLLQLARDAVSMGGWWLPYGDLQFRAYIEMEDAAVEVEDFETELVPGLLQTPAYARLTLGAILPSISDDERETLVRIRMARKPLLDRPTKPYLRAVIDEAAIRRGSAYPEIMAPQIRALLDTPDNVSVQVLPFTAGFHAGSEGAFTVLRLPDDLPDKAYVETSGGELYVESINGVRRCSLMFEEVAKAALSPIESADWLRNFAKELGS